MIEHFRAISLDWISKRDIQRIPEPMLMLGKEQAREFHDYCEGDNDARIYLLYHAVQMSRTISKCRQVVDLGCGSGNLLSLLARMNPHIHFIGVDLSAEMLHLAEEQMKNLNIKNVEFRLEDITSLKSITDKSVDGIISNSTLHHMPDEAKLDQFFQTCVRVLKNHYAIYLSDFILLKTKLFIDHLISLNKCTHKFIVEDYRNSLLAAFPAHVYKEMRKKYLPQTTFYKTVIVDFAMILKTKSYDTTDEVKKVFDSEWSKLSALNRKLYKDTALLFWRI